MANIKLQHQICKEILFRFFSCRLDVKTHMKMNQNKIIFPYFFHNQNSCMPPHNNIITLQKWTPTYSIPNMHLYKVPHSYGIKYLIRSKPVDEINSLRDCLKYRANLTSYINIVPLLCLRFYHSLKYANPKIYQRFTTKPEKMRYFQLKL